MSPFSHKITFSVNFYRQSTLKIYLKVDVENQSGNNFVAAEMQALPSQRPKAKNVKV
jgi:hypothetical protein